MTETSNARIRTMDLPILDEVFVKGDGFVLNSGRGRGTSRNRPYSRPS